MADPNARRDQQVSASPISSFMHWLQVKNYQYEVTTSLYMLTSTEKIVFNCIILILISLLVTAAYLYLPAHIFIIYSRVWYYISGEFTNHGAHSGVGGITDSLKATKEVLVSQTVTSYLAKTTVGWKDEV